MSYVRILATCLGVSVLASGCTFMQKDFNKYGRNYDDVPIEAISVGDSKSEVVAALGSADKTVGTLELEQCSVEVWEYQKWNASIGSDSMEQRYWLYFLDDNYYRWTSPMDWQSEARRICSERN